jgi:aspartokinase-like uncharacterized kinase
MPVAVVVRVGGGLLAGVEHFEAVLAGISDASRRVPLLVVPGGGPFADAVREVDDLLSLPDEATHWMAVLAMDQYAHLIASRLPGSRLVMRSNDIEAALYERSIPVLAPYRWMREADPLPHSWDVTSDSIAAWLAGQLGVRLLVLIKPYGASGPNLVDPYFSRALPAGIAHVILSADRIGELQRVVSVP